MAIQSPVLALAFAEDALALASWAEAQGFSDDAIKLREFSARVRAQLPRSRRWEQVAS